MIDDEDDARQKSNLRFGLMYNFNYSLIKCQNSKVLFHFDVQFPFKKINTKKRYMLNENVTCVFIQFK